MTKKVTRLFGQFQPDNYDLRLNLNREAMTFSGVVTVKGKKVGRPSQRFTFHQKHLNIKKASVTKHDKKGNKKLPVARINTQASFDEVRLHTSEMVYPGQYTITMEFAGPITRPMTGIYPCFFKHRGSEKILIATQFESHHAREAFPCIDEPEAKATFDLSLISPKDETVIANTPVKKQSTVKKSEGPQPSSPNQLTSFQTTPKMSTYLLAFVVGELGYLEGKTKDGVAVRTYATPDNIKHTAFALDCAIKTLEFYNDYFGIPYPLAKCDFVALPDFASGAMENWGCITFREQALLFDRKNTSLRMKQYIANVVAHELTHQWFGNLVTMRWWTDLWLNESFASWMSWLAVDKMFPKWKVWTQFIVEEQGQALKLDALENTHPIEVKVNHPDEIRTIFDAISYEKGASVLLMLHDYLGQQVFRDGLRLYLKRHAYGNTDTADLWSALEEVSGRPVKTFMSRWTRQAGYPIVRAAAHKNKLSLRQEPFYLNPSAHKSKSFWTIPLLPTEQLPIDTLDTFEQTVPVNSVSSSFLLNHNRTSFFRSIYNTEHLKRLASSVKNGKLDDLDRLGLLNDSFEAAKAGYAPTTDTLTLLDAYRGETSDVVWDIIAGVIGSLRLVMDDDGIRAGLKPFVRKLSAVQLKRLGWNERKNDSHFDRLLRPNILGLASYGEEPTVVAEALRIFAACQKPEDIHPDLRGVVYGTATRHGSRAEFDKMLAMHNASTNSEDRVTLAAALTNFKQPALIQRALAEITSSDVRLQDALYWLAYSFGNRHARKATWKWLIINWDWLIQNIGADISFSQIPLYVGRAFSDKKFLPTFTAFFETHINKTLERPVKQAIETISWQAAWKDRDLARLKKYFESTL